MGAIYTVETRITIPVGDSGAGYCVGLSSNGGSAAAAPSSGVIHSIGVSLRDPSAGLPGSGDYALAVYAISLTIAGQAEVDRAAYQVLQEVPITPAPAVPTYNGPGMFFQGALNGTPATAYKARSPDVFLTNGGSGYKYSCGRRVVPASGFLWICIETDGNVTGEGSFVVSMAIEGKDTAKQGDPQAFYRNADPGSF